MIQKTGSIHVYFQRNKGHLAGVILCSILAGMGETMWAFVFQKIGELPGDMTKAAILRLAGILLFTVFLLCSQSECLRLLSEDISEADQYTAEEGCVRCSAGSGYDPVYEQQQWDVSLNTE